MNFAQLESGSEIEEAVIVAFLEDSWRYLNRADPELTRDRIGSAARPNSRVRAGPGRFA
jgi:hypothetical protein